MAIALVGSRGTATQGTSGASLTPAYGQSPTAGNLLILTVAVTGSATLPTTPANWSVGVQKAGTSTSATIYWKTAAGADAQPTINAITSALIAGQLSEYSGAVKAVDQSANAVGTTSPNTATAGAANNQTGELIVMTGADRRSTARASNDTWTSNDGTVTLAGSNNGTSSTDHYSFGAIVGSTATTAQTSVLTLSITTSITGIANVNASFNILAAQAPAPTALSLTFTGATPSVVKGTNVTPTALSLTFTGATPTVAVTNNVLVQPSALALTWTGATPTVSTPVAVAPSALALTWSGATPTVKTPVATQPAAMSLTWTGSVPAVSTPVAIAPAAMALTWTGATPIVTAPAVALPAALALAWTGSVPTVSISGQPQPVADVALSSRGQDWGAPTMPYQSTFTTPAPRSVPVASTIELLVAAREDDDDIVALLLAGV